jgi:hypothetical protein
MLCRIDGHHFWLMLCCHVVKKAPSHAYALLLWAWWPHPWMLRRVDGLVLADALPPWFRRMLRCHGRRFCGYTTLLPTIVLSLLMLGSVGWGCMVEVPLLFSCCSFVLVGFVGNPWITCESYVFFFLMKYTWSRVLEKSLAYARCCCWAS